MSASVMSNTQLQPGLSSFMDEDLKAKLSQKQGIVSILGSGDGDGTTKSTASLRRTLSADMSSKKWLSMKKIASSGQIFYEKEEDDQEEEEQFKKPAGQFDIWTSIVCKKSQEQDDSVPYVHPLVKRSASTLSHKSLEVCTESLGSETGSDGFSSYPSSDTDDGYEGEGLQQQQEQQEHHGSDFEDVRVVKYNFPPAGKKLPPPSFPPPLPSLTDRRMMPRRENGRLVLEAVAVSAQSNFKAERQGGRLVLTFLKSQDQATVQQVEQQSPNDQELDEEFEKKCRQFETIKLHRLALRACGAQKYNEIVQLKKLNNQVQQHLPRPVMLNASLATVNGFDYCWRAEPTTAQAMEKNNMNKHIISSIYANNHNQELAEKNPNQMVPSLKGCKEHRRAIFWEPYCIATSY